MQNMQEEQEANEKDYVVVRMKKSVRDKLHVMKYKYGFKSISELLEKFLKTLE